MRDRRKLQEAEAARQAEVRRASMRDTAAGHTDIDHEAREAPKEVTDDDQG